MSPASSLRITNYAFAAGRIGLAIVMVPILVAVGAYMIAYSFDDLSTNTNDNIITVALGVMLILFSLPFLWLGITTPTSIRVGERIEVNYMCRTCKYSLEDAIGIDESTESTEIFTPGSATLSMLYGNSAYSERAYKICILRLKKGKRVKFQLPAEQRIEFLNRLKI